MNNEESNWHVIFEFVGEDQKVKEGFLALSAKTIREALCEAEIILWAVDQSIVIVEIKRQ